MGGELIWLLFLGLEVKVVGYWLKNEMLMKVTDEAVWWCCSSDRVPSPSLLQNEEDQAVAPGVTADGYAFQVPDDQSTFNF